MPSSDHWDAQVSGVHVEHPELRGLGERNYDVGVFSRTSILGMGKAEQEAETLKRGVGLLAMASPWGEVDKLCQIGGSIGFVDGLAGREHSAGSGPQGCP